MSWSNHHSELTVVGRPSDLAEDFKTVETRALRTNDFSRFIRENYAPCTAMLVGDSDYEPVTLPAVLTIRDFPEIKSLGVLRG